MNGEISTPDRGGLVSNIDGTAYDAYTPDALATNGPLHPFMVEIFKRGLKANNA